MFYDLQEAVGEPEMDKALQSLVQNYEYRIAQPEDYLATFEQIIGPHTKAYFQTWMHQSMIYGSK